MWRKCYKNISNENYVKLSYLPKMKELVQIVLQNMLFASIKGHICLTKGHLDNLERHCRISLHLWMSLSDIASVQNVDMQFCFTKNTMDQNLLYICSLLEQVDINSI